MNKKLVKLLAIIGVYILNVLLLLAIGKLVVPEDWSNNLALGDVVTILQEIEMTVVFVLLSSKIFKIKINIGKKNLVKGIFWYGLVMCIAVAVNLAMNYATPERSIMTALPFVLIEFITMMSIGVAEETVFRGVIFGACREYFGESKKGIYLSVFVSALIFGGWHLPNLLFRPDLVVATITQVIYAAEVGIIFAVIYYRSENLLPCIILHGLFDFANSFWICFADDVNDALNTQNTTDIDITSALGLITICLPFVISGIWQLRTVFKKQQIIER
ncbi:MAG: CPBP family intramembrane metalloprotease [Lachnospiraceae bacterium]|nr:CPBP family intramembrane metalloprotease [Lachnospiraceae bacterium]